MANAIVKRLELMLHRHQQLQILFFDDHSRLKPEAAYYIRWLQRICCDELPCYAVNKITGAVDPIATGVALGRREVYLEHRKWLKLDVDEIQTQLNTLREEELWQTKQQQAQ